MTLSLASPSFLEPEGLGLVRDLGAHGVAVAASTLQGLDAQNDAIEALRAGDVDLVLSPGAAQFQPLEGIGLAAVLPREEPRDLLVPASSVALTLTSLPAGSRVGVAGARREAFLRAHDPSARPVPQGNGGGPVAALDGGLVDALILGADEARRLGLTGRASEALDPKTWIPSPAQGTVVLLARNDDPHTVAAVRSADDFRARISLEAEIATRTLLGAGAHTPLGVLAQPYGRWIRLHGMVATSDGRRMVRAELSAGDRRPGAAAQALVSLLRERGVDDLLEGGA